jgi:hypothetical protein
MFVLRLRAQPGIDGVKALRWLLKRAQRLGLKAIDAVEEQEKSDSARGLTKQRVSFKGTRESPS